jgi:hypothetical protein
MSRFIICILHRILFEERNNERCGYVACMGNRIIHTFAQKTRMERLFGRPGHKVG